MAYERDIAAVQYMAFWCITQMALGQNNHLYLERKQFFNKFVLEGNAGRGEGRGFMIIPFGNLLFIGNVFKMRMMRSLSDGN